MKIDCTIDGKALSLSINSNKPLSLILEEDIQNTSISSHCSGRMCGLCVVLMDGKAVLSCLVPAFEIEHSPVIMCFPLAKLSEDVPDDDSSIVRYDPSTFLTSFSEASDSVAAVPQIPHKIPVLIIRDKIRFFIFF